MMPIQCWHVLSFEFSSPDGAIVQTAAIRLTNGRGVSARLELTRDRDPQVSRREARAEFVAPDAIRAWSACLEVADCVIVATAGSDETEAGSIDSLIVSRQATNPKLSLSGPGAWTAIATKAGFGEDFAHVVAQLAFATTAKREVTIRSLRRERSVLKHGPGGSGERGPCDPDCHKCEVEREIGRLAPDGRGR